MNPDESKKRTARIAPFILAILCFLMPFVEVSCKDENGKVIEQQSFSGMKLAFGGTAQQKNPMTGQMEEQPVKQQTDFLIALICAAAGVGTAFMAGQNGKLFPAVAGVAGIIFMVVGRSDLTGGMPAEAREALGISMQIGFILVCILLGVGAVVSAMQWKDANTAPPAAPPPPPPGAGGPAGSNLPPVPGQPPPPGPPPA